MTEKHWRSIAKAVSYRITGTITTIAISWVITRTFAFAISIGFADVVIKVFVYYLHERAWNNIHAGRHAQDYQI
ncbi:MAG TPA: DUF2061 domain-containing protein [Candidatus Omnitrophota bacterium]|nr:DUF2061 domain-containing protein [Candidatus Omnitrophota bacterium]